jgi:hypothetical protein
MSRSKALSTSRALLHAQWTTAAGLRPDDEPDYPQESAYLVLARVLLAQNDPGPAFAQLPRLLAAAASQGRASGTPGPPSEAA